MSAERFYVRIDRADGSRHYKGAWNRAHCQREADAWVGSFPDYNVSLVPAGDESVRRDVRAWQRQVNHDQAINIITSYFPSDMAGVA